MTEFTFFAILLKESIVAIQSAFVIERIKREANPERHHLRFARREKAKKIHGEGAISSFHRTYRYDNNNVDSGTIHYHKQIRQVRRRRRLRDE
jgi:hypothetical protein